jgi:hypothetical protein
MKGWFWTEEDDAKILEMYAEGHTAAQIADVFRYRTVSSIKCRYARLKGRIPAHRPFTANDDMMIQSLMEAGYSPTQIAGVMEGRTAQQIRERQDTLRDYSGYNIHDFMAEMSMHRKRAGDWLYRRGYDVVDDVVQVRKTAIETEHEITQRVITALPSAPCWRCGARSCSHTAPAWGVATMHPA